MTERNWLPLAGLFLGIFGLVVIGFYLYKYNHRIFYLIKSSDSQEMHWIALGEVPHRKEKYPPQGLTYVNGKLIFSNHWKDTKSGLFLFDSKDMTLEAVSSMPHEAIHTSGLAWDGTFLWAVDYKSNYLYKLDMEKTFKQDTAYVLDKYPTSLEGTSASTIITIDDKQYVAVSDFERTCRTYIFDLKNVDMLKKSPISEVAIISYSNESFSQGLTWDGLFLYEALNKVGTDQINVYDIKDAIRQQKSHRIKKVRSFSGPSPSIEDLATDGKYLWTSDEKTYRFYKLKL